MRSGFRRRAAALAMMVVAAAGCRDRKPAAIEEQKVDLGAAPRNVEARLFVATDWAWNEDDSLRVTVVNGTDQPLSGALNLFIGAPVEVRMDSAGSRSTGGGAPTIAPVAGGTQVTFPIATLAPGASGEFAQAVRTPPAPRGRPAAPADTATRFAVRAWVAGADGRELAAAGDTIRIRAGSEVVTGGCGGIADVAVTRYGIGPVRLDMKAADVRTLCPEARDTTWRGQEGIAEKGLAVRLAGNPVLLVLSGDAVSRIVVDTAGMRTGVGVGVGSTLGDLRGRYGSLCTGQAENAVAVWSPAAPGISFGLDTAATAGWSAARLPPDSLPGEARVTSMWVRKGSDACPPAQPSR